MIRVQRDKIYLNVTIVAGLLHYHTNVIFSKIRSGIFTETAIIGGSKYIKLTEVERFTGYKINLDKVEAFAVLNSNN